MRRPALSPLLPYTTLFRSVVRGPVQPVPVAAREIGLDHTAPGLVAHPFAQARHACIELLPQGEELDARDDLQGDRKSTRLNSSHVAISYAVFCLKKKSKQI